MTVDMSRVVPEHNLRGDDEEDTRLLSKMAGEAREYLEHLGHWDRVDRLYFGFGVGGVIGIFLADASPRRTTVDSRVWVVVGDVPPLYLVTDRIHTPATALRVYIDLRREWIDAVRRGSSVDELAPVNAAPTEAAAEALAQRLALLEEILGEQREDEHAGDHEHDRSGLDRDQQSRGEPDQSRQQDSVDRADNPKQRL